MSRLRPKINAEQDEDWRVIWLSPICEGGTRAWCQDNAWTECRCGKRHHPVRYVRARNQGEWPKGKQE